MEKIKKLWQDYRWWFKFDVISRARNLVYNYSCHHLFARPQTRYNRLMRQVWDVIHDWLGCHFNLMFKTRWGRSGLDWWGLIHFELFFGRFCSVRVDGNLFSIRFCEREYYDYRVASCSLSYYAYQYGHRIKWVFEEGSREKLLAVSQWFWGKYRPHAPEANVIWEGKIWGLIGYGKKQPREPVFVFENPPLCYFSAQISDFIVNNGWYVCAGCENEHNCPGDVCEYPLNSRVVIPFRPRGFIRKGDVVMFFDHDKDGHDLFWEIEEWEIEEWRKGQSSLLPIGVVFRPGGGELVSLKAAISSAKCKKIRGQLSGVALC